MRIFFSGLFLSYLSYGWGLLSARPSPTSSLSFSTPQLTRSLHRLHTTLPLPSILNSRMPNKLFSTAKIYSFPILLQLRNLSLQWKTFIIMSTAILARFRSRIKRNIKDVTNKMEAGWSQRGYGGSTKRTLEIWTFAFKFGFQYVNNLSLF